MDSFEDEDVIFPNSQLHQYLSDLNLWEEDFENVRKKSPESEKFRQESRETISLKEKKVFHDLVQKIKSCRCISEDDACFLENFQLELDKVGFELKPDNSKRYRYFPVALGIVTSATCCYRFRGPFKFLGCCLTLLALKLAKPDLFNISNFISNYTKCNLIFKFQCDLSKSLAASELFCNRLARTLRYMDEVNILRRGFTLTTAVSSAAKEFVTQRSGLPDVNFQLRCDLFHLVREIYLIFRQFTRKLVKLVPLISSLDNVSSYAAFINLSEFGDLLRKHDAEKLANETGNFSIAAIKSISQLCELQISEFLRRLAMCFCVDYWSDPHKVSEISVFNILHPILRDVTEHVTVATTNLQRTYNVLRFSSQIKTQIASKPTKQTANNLITTVVHSLTLHLQTSFESAFNLEEIVEKMNDNDICSTQNLKYIEEHLEDIQRQITVCRSCVEQGVQLLEKRRNPSNKNVPLLANVERDNSESPEISRIIHRLDEEVPVVDQVFEAYVQKSDTFDNDTRNYERTEEEKMDLEATSSMFKELKSVLVVKAAEFRYREAKAQGIEEPLPDDNLVQCNTDHNDVKHEETPVNNYSVNDDQCEVTTAQVTSNSFMKDLAMLAVKKSHQFAFQQETFISEDFEVDSDHEDDDN